MALQSEKMLGPSFPRVRLVGYLRFEENLSRSLVPPCPLRSHCGSCLFIQFQQTLSHQSRFVHFAYFVVPISKESAVSFSYRKGAEVAEGRKALVDEATMMDLIFYPTCITQALLLLSALGG